MDLDDPVWGLVNLSGYTAEVIDVDRADVERAQQRNRVYIVGVHNTVGQTAQNVGKFVAKALACDARRAPDHLGTKPGIPPHPR